MEHGQITVTRWLRGVSAICSNYLSQKNIRRYNTTKDHLTIYYTICIAGREANAHKAGDQKYMLTIEDRAVGFGAGASIVLFHSYTRCKMTTYYVNIIVVIQSSVKLEIKNIILFL